jgi:hypothetical protein
MSYMAIALFIYLPGCIAVLFAIRYIPAINRTVVQIGDDTADRVVSVLIAMGFWPVIVVVLSFVGVTYSAYCFAAGKPLVKPKEPESPVVPELKRIDIMAAWMPLPVDHEEKEGLRFLDV